MTKDDRYGATDDTYGDDLDGYSESGSVATVERDRRQEETDRRDVERESAEEEEPASEDSGPELPFIFARRTVKADREAVPVYLQSEIANEVANVERELAERFDGDKIMSLDVREALIQAGLRNMSDVETVMEEWGYGRR